MKKFRILRLFGLVSIFAVVLVFVGFHLLEAQAEPTTWTVDDNGPADFSSIQGAINAAIEGDTISVYSGTYYENVVVDKTLTLIGEDKEITVIYGSSVSADVVRITADGVSITGFTMTNSGSSSAPHKGGIGLNEVANCTIDGNNVHNNQEGITLINSNYNTIKNNTCENNQNGMILWSQSPGTSSNNMVYNNTCFENQYYGINLWSYVGGTTTTNNNQLVKNNCYLNNIGGIYVASAINNILSENNCSQNRYGINLNTYSQGTTKNNTVTNNNVSDNGYGIYLYGAYASNTENTIVGNTIANNYYYGVLSAYAYNNQIYHNNIIDNIAQSYDTNPATNYWHHPTLPEGNYWSDYTGEDIDGDGIGDTLIPHPSEGFDYYPFIRKIGGEIIIEVTIDIKPGSDPNSINLGELGLLPVAILGSADFDVETIDPATIEIGGVSLAERGSKKAPKLAYSLENVDGDIFTDMIAFFDVQTLVNDGILNDTTVALILTATLDDGTPIEGTDSVNIVN